MPARNNVELDIPGLSGTIKKLMGFLLPAGD
jgi:hypothetical protein